MEKTAKKTNRAVYDACKNVRKYDIYHSIRRMSADDRKDVAMTFGFDDWTKPTILAYALRDEFIAGYVLQY